MHAATMYLAHLSALGSSDNLLLHHFALSAGKLTAIRAENFTKNILSDGPTATTTIGNGKNT